MGRTRPRPWGARRGAKRGASLAWCDREGRCGSEARLWRGQLRRPAAPLEVRDAAMGTRFQLLEGEASVDDRVWLVRAPPATVLTASGAPLLVASLAPAQFPLWAVCLWRTGQAAYKVQPTQQV